MMVLGMGMPEFIKVRCVKAFIVTDSDCPGGIKDWITKLLQITGQLDILVPEQDKISESGFSTFRVFGYRSTAAHSSSALGLYSAFLPLVKASDGSH